MASKLNDFYCNYIVNWLSGGALVNKSSMSSLGIRPLYDRIITKSSVKKIICVAGFPLDFDRSFSSTLSRKVSETYQGCKVNISMQCFNSNLNVRSSDFKRSMADSERRYNQYKRTFDSLSESDRAVGKKIYGAGGGSATITKQQLDALKDSFDSYKYCNEVSRAKRKRGISPCLQEGICLFCDLWGDAPQLSKQCLRGCSAAYGIGEAYARQLSELCTRG